MTNITIWKSISKNKSHYLVWEEFEILLDQFVLDYIETKEDLELRNSLSNDMEYKILNRKLEEKLWSISL